jgi:hypothetical protein
VNVLAGSGGDSSMVPMAENDGVTTTTQENPKKIQIHTIERI